MRHVGYTLFIAMCAFMSAAFVFGAEWLAAGIYGVAGVVAIAMWLGWVS